MRYLNKIIFINSAHIRYAEVKLDGNVHFIGTQGVGKSTLLRAILFFYNADKSKLGIQREQKGFDDFYLPSPDSYIIYEVVRENGKFFIAAFKNQGRTAFRFVDCEYQREFFLDHAGNVYYEWNKIHLLIGRHHYSNIIRHYSTYLDIIYGNRQNLPTDLRRYAIMESGKYQNVPRTIQNIFLNQSLESRVIKDIIIDSMDFNNGGINLNFYRSQVKDFRQQYEDIWKWFKKEKNGRVKVQGDAEQVISKYTLYESTKKMVEELCCELSYALERDKNRVPLLRQQHGEMQDELNRQNRLLQEEEGKNKTERDKLVGEEANLKEKLATIKKKKQHYADIDIDNISRCIVEKEVIETRQHAIQQQVNTLTDKNRTITDKYNVLKAQEMQKSSSFQNQTEANKNLLKEQLYRLVADMQTQYTKAREEKQAFYLQRRNSLQEKEDAAKEEKHQLQLSQLKIQQLNPFQQEIDEYQRKTDAIRQNENNLKITIQQCQQQAESLIAQTKMERNKLENCHEIYINNTKQQMEQLSEQSINFQHLLDRQKGSLIEWLSSHAAGWEDTFGKVLDEDAVLYNTELSPCLTKKDDTVFGVTINLDNIEKSVRTPEDIIREKEIVDRKIEKLHSDIKIHITQLKVNIANLESKPSNQLKALRQQRADAETEIRIIPIKIKTNQKLLAEATDRLTTWRKNELENNQVQFAKVEQELMLLAQEKLKLEQQEKRELDKLKRSVDARHQEVETTTLLQISMLDKKMKQQQEDCASEIRLLDTQMDAELKGLGVDVKQLSTFRLEMDKMSRKLRFIDEHYRDFIAWQNDKEELFDHEMDMRDQQKLVQQKLADLEDKYQVRKNKYTTTIGKLRNELQQLKTEADTISHAITDTENFISSNSSPVHISATSQQETVKQLVDLLNTLRDQISVQLRQMDNFKVSVTTFKKNFSPQNTFHFRTEINLDADYVQFAIDLNEFLSNRKIEEYRQRTNHVYIDIIQRISREVNDLMSHKGMIEGTISEINKDFKENNFAGVIKDIELRSVESNDRLMQLLLTIAHFVESSNMNLGEVNLFSNMDTLQKDNQRAVELLMDLMDNLDLEQKRELITLTDTFKLEFKVRENDNDTGWVEKLSNVGSDGTDILVKAMVNIMLINVFKRKVSRKFGDFNLHCLMDEIGKLHPNNVKGILDFANKRNIYLVNSSPTTYTAEAYRYTYALSKDAKSNTIVKSLLTIR